MTQKFNSRQRMFIKRMAHHGVARKAAQEAGYAPHNPQSAASQGTRLAHDPEIAAAIDELKQGKMSLDGLTSDEFLEFCEGKVLADGQNAGVWARFLVEGRGWNKAAPDGKDKIPLAFGCD